MRKTKLPGENISLKTKKTEDPAVMKWINAQTNLMDSLRYLIENEIYRNGVRNLQTFVPVERSVLTQSSAASEIGAARDKWDGVPQAATALSENPAEVPRQPAVPDREPNPAHRTESQASRPADDEIDDDDIEAWT